MMTTEGTELANKKPRKNQEPGIERVPIKLDSKTSARMRIVAATRGISFSELSRELLKLGLGEYLKGGHLDLGALEAMETAAAVNAAKEATA